MFQGWMPQNVSVPIKSVFKGRPKLGQRVEQG